MLKKGDWSDVELPLGSSDGVCVLCPKYRPIHRGASWIIKLLSQLDAIK